MHEPIGSHARIWILGDKEKVGKCQTRAMAKTGGFGPWARVSENGMQIEKTEFFVDVALNFDKFSYGVGNYFDTRHGQHGILTINP